MALPIGDCLEIGTCAGYDFGGVVGSPGGAAWAVRNLPLFEGYEPRLRGPIVGSQEPDEADTTFQTTQATSTSPTSNQPPQAADSRSQAEKPSLIIPALIILAAWAFRN